MHALKLLAVGILYTPPLCMSPAPLEGYFQGWRGCGCFKFGPAVEIVSMRIPKRICTKALLVWLMICTCVTNALGPAQAIDSGELQEDIHCLNKCSVIHAQFDWMTRAQDNGNEWRKFRGTLFCTLLKRGGNRRAGGDHVHCAVEPSPGHTTRAEIIAYMIIWRGLNILSM